MVFTYFAVKGYRESCLLHIPKMIHAQRYLHLWDYTDHRQSVGLLDLQFLSSLKFSQMNYIYGITLNKNEEVSAVVPGTVLGM